MPATAPALHDATIVSREYRPPGFWCVSIRCPEITATAQPAQYVAIDVAGAFMVRLPLGVFSVSGDQFTVIFREWGERTKRLAHAYEGEHVSCIGPLGNAFVIPDRDARATIVAGGLGVSPFWLLAQALRKAGVETTIVLGARSRDQVVGAGDLRAHGFPIHICTDDGSDGFCGTAVDRLRELGSPDIIYGCGPPAMLRSLCTLAMSNGVRCQVSMEETFACSMGTCWGCVVPVRRGAPQGTGYPHAPSEQRDFDFARICTDGTVFEATDLLWPK